MQRTVLFVLGVLTISAAGSGLAQGQRGAAPVAPGQGQAQGQGQGRGQGGRGGGAADWHPLPALPLEQGATQADVARALTAAPSNLGAEATVVKWKPDFTYDTLRKGLNRLVCYDLSGRPTHPVFETECTSVGNLPRVAQNLKFEASDQRQAMLDAAEKDGTRVKPEFGSIWYHLMGPNRWGASPHMTIAVPGATTQTLGLPQDGSGGGVWIMNAGTSTAHLMIPNEPVVIPAGTAPPPAPTPLPLEAGAVQAEVNRIALAAPGNLAAEATVIAWKPDFTYTTLRKGKNKLVCYDLADRPMHQPFAAECTTVGNLPRVAQNLKFEAMPDHGLAMFESSEKDGTRVKPEYGSLWYDLTGPHRWDARLHTTIWLPGATRRMTGLPDNDTRGGAWIVNAGTGSARLVTPGDPPAILSLAMAP